ncbi:MAG: hypothetical protein PHF17_06845 [Arcobacteraceae bacterium]|nr:hypothetical protein [Arcobacteraceae bacterium]
MSNNLNTIKIIEKFSILNYLPKKCYCSMCKEIKDKVKAEVGEKEFQKICQVLNLG